MILKIKQKVMSVMGKYEILDEADQIAYKIQGRMSLPKRFEITDASGAQVAVMKSKVFDLMPTFRLFIGGAEVGRVKKKITMFKPAFKVDCNNWKIQGNILGWDYDIVDAEGKVVASLSKKVISLVDYYTMDIVNPDDALMVIMIALAIDVEKQ
ncbi:MAG: LURP-one-related family protein [Clostridia bacterium]|nr:LURP-one-related family protein [Clostridia bacterium]MDE7215366.1 LURP-one-related family protein [Clostridia bacterium]MDE7336960.1 LURP-one-related family protein [Clostridia bacterium]